MSGDVSLSGLTALKGRPFIHGLELADEWGFQHRFKTLMKPTFLYLYLLFSFFDVNYKLRQKLQ